MNKVAMNMCIQIFVWACDLFSINTSKIIELYGKYLFSFLR